MARLTDTAYESKTTSMVSKFTPEQRDAKLVDQYMKNRRLENALKQLQAKCKSLMDELDTAQEKIQQLKNKLDLGHLKPYRIRFAQLPEESLQYQEFDEFEDLDHSKASEATLLSYQHEYDQRKMVLCFVDRDFYQRVYYGVVMAVVDQ